MSNANAPVIETFEISINDLFNREAMYSDFLKTVVYHARHTNFSRPRQSVVDTLNATHEGVHAFVMCLMCATSRAQIREMHTIAKGVVDTNEDSQWFHAAATALDHLLNTPEDDNSSYTARLKVVTDYLRGYYTRITQLKDYMDSLDFVTDCEDPIDALECYSTMKNISDKALAEKE